MAQSDLTSTWQRLRRCLLPLGLRLGYSREDSEDLLQDSVTRSLAQLPALRHEGAFYSYVKKTFLHLCSERAKEHEIDLVPLEKLGPDEVYMKGVLPTLKVELSFAFVHQLILRTTHPKRKEVARRFYLEHQKVREIAAQLQMKESTVCSHLYRFRVDATDMTGDWDEVTDGLYPYGFLIFLVLFACEAKDPVLHEISLECGVDELKAGTTLVKPNFQREAKGVYERGGSYWPATRTSFGCYVVPREAKKLVIQDHPVPLHYSLDPSSKKVLYKLRAEDLTISDKNRLTSCSDQVVYGKEIKYLESDWQVSGDFLHTDYEWRREGEGVFFARFPEENLPEGDYELLIKNRLVFSEEIISPSKCVLTIDRTPPLIRLPKGPQDVREWDRDLVLEPHLKEVIYCQSPLQEKEGESGCERVEDLANLRPQKPGAYQVRVEAEDQAGSRSSSEGQVELFDREAIQTGLQSVNVLTEKLLSSSARSYRQKLQNALEEFFEAGGPFSDLIPRELYQGFLEGIPKHRLVKGIHLESSFRKVDHSHSGEFLVSSEEGAVHLGKHLEIIKWLSKRERLFFLPDGGRVAVHLDQKIVVQRGKEVQVISLPKPMKEALFSAEGEMGVLWTRKGELWRVDLKNTSQPLVKLARLERRLWNQPLVLDSKGSQLSTFLIEGKGSEHWVSVYQNLLVGQERLSFPIWEATLPEKLWVFSEGAALSGDRGEVQFLIPRGEKKPRAFKGQVGPYGFSQIIYDPPRIEWRLGLAEGSGECGEFLVCGDQLGEVREAPLVTQDFSRDGELIYQIFGEGSGPYVLSALSLPGERAVDLVIDQIPTDVYYEKEQSLLTLFFTSGVIEQFLLFPPLAAFQRASAHLKAELTQGGAKFASLSRCPFEEEPFDWSEGRAFVCFGDDESALVEKIPTGFRLSLFQGEETVLTEEFSDVVGLLALPEGGGVLVCETTLHYFKRGQLAEALLLPKGLRIHRVVSGQGVASSGYGELLIPLSLKGMRLFYAGTGIP